MAVVERQMSPAFRRQATAALEPATLGTELANGAPGEPEIARFAFNFLNNFVNKILYITIAKDIIHNIAIAMTATIAQ